MWDMLLENCIATLSSWVSASLMPLRDKCQSLKSCHKIFLIISGKHKMNKTYSDYCTLLRDLESLFAAQNNCLQHLMGRDMGFKISRIPQLADKLSKTLYQQKGLIPWWPLYLGIVFFLQEIISQRSYMW